MLIVALALASVACSAVRVHDTDHARVVQRDDALTHGGLSGASREALLMLGLDATACVKQPQPCLAQLRDTRAIDDERRLSTLAELQLSNALARERAHAAAATVMDAYAEVARLAYAYLFFTARDPAQRAFEDRQAQVRDFYNVATERLTTLLFEQTRDSKATAPEDLQLQLSHWRIRADEMLVRMPRGRLRPYELAPASRLRFDGLRSTFRRDGFGASFVAIAAPSKEQPDFMREPHYLAATVVVRFAGDTLAEVMATTTAIVDVHDPYQYDQVHIGQHAVPLAANFTAPYALWLSRSRFARQAERALFRRSAGLAKPRVYLLQPYDPQRRTVVLLHGLHSSPEAWVNLANEIMGDDALRRRYQLWQVFYPTNLPIAESRRNIRQALLDTLATLDPDANANASHNLTLVGHSMGGVLSRLLVVDSGNALWQTFFDKPMDAAQKRRYALLDPYLSLRPLPQIDRAIFLAAPHRGSPMARGLLGRAVSRVVRLPLTAVRTVSTVANAIQADAPEKAEALRRREMDSIENLSDQSRYLRATSALPIATGVTYHSIIGRKDPAVPLAASSDGVVPYSSSHLDGAMSELIVTSGHGVQETPAAILEIRRILREAANPPGVAQPPLQSRGENSPRPTEM